MISAVDLLKGIGVGAGLKNIIVEGADGTLETNYEGKAQAAVDALTKDGYDFAYIHVEAPGRDGTPGQRGAQDQIHRVSGSESDPDRERGYGCLREEYRMLVLPDHPTPIVLRTHTSDPVPYMLF